MLLVKTIWCPRAKKTLNALGQQYLELSTCMWSGRATWNRGKFVCQSAIEVGQRFSLEKTLILQQEYWFIIRQRHRITKGKFEHSMSSTFYFGAKNGSPMFGNLPFDRCRHSPGRKIVVLFTTKYALPRQIKPRILELSIRRWQSNSSIVLIFVGCWKK